MALPSMKTAFNTARNVVGVAGICMLVGAAYASNLGPTFAMHATNFSSFGGMLGDGVNMIPGVAVG